MVDNKKPKTNFEALQPYIRANIDIIPLHQANTISHSGRPIGKAPLHKNWRTRRYSAKQIIEHMKKGNNVGWRLGAEDLILDADPRNYPKGRDVLAELLKELGEGLSKAPGISTGGGGTHIYMKKPVNRIVSTTLPDWPGIELKAEGTQVVVGGSVHPSGGLYEWNIEISESSPVIKAPEIMLAMFNRPKNTSTPIGVITSEELALMLNHLPIKEFQDHSIWLSIMMACHHATSGEGRQEFLDWSASDPKYKNDSWEIGRRWDSLAFSGPSSRTVTSRTLFREVVKYGGEKDVPRESAEDDFSEASLNKEDDGEEQESPLEEMNRRFAVVSEAGKFKVFSSGWDPALKRHFHARSTRKDLEDLLANRQIEIPGLNGESKVVPLAPWWLKHSRRRQYDGVLFDPEAEHPGWLNLWTGWSVEPKRGDWSLLRKLIEEILCGGEKESSEYVIKWAANMIQKPGTPAEVAICFKGAKGTGKGTFGRALIELAGRHGLHVSSPAHLTGRFNAHLRDVIALFADEAFWAGDKQHEGVLKQLVTEPTLAFEAKGIDIAQGRNTLHLIMASNSDWVIPAGLDGERRFAVFEVSNAAQGDLKRFGAINNQMKSGGLAAMLYDLLRINLGNWHPRNSVPKTKALKEQKLRSMSEVEEWWLGALDSGVPPGGNMVDAKNWVEGPVKIWVQRLYEDYLSVAQAIGARRRISKVRIGRELQRLAPGVRKVQSPAGDDIINLEADARGRATAYWLPSLEECREVMENMLGGYSWADQESKPNENWLN